MLDTQAALALVQRHGDEYADCADTYGEPGYTDSARGILLANWNHIPKYIQAGLERRGFALEWSDEWLTETSTSPVRAFRTQPDCWSWQPSYVQADWCDGEIIPHADIIADSSLRQSYVEEYLLNNTNAAAWADFNPSEDGFTLCEPDYETGFYPGQNDTPESALAALAKAYPNHDFIFQIDSVRQFDMSWSAWRRPMER